jgi:hypothetical protein
MAERAIARMAMLNRTIAPSAAPAAPAPAPAPTPSVSVAPAPTAASAAATAAPAASGPTDSKSAGSAPAKSTDVQESRESVPLHPELQTALDNYRKARNFNADKWIVDKCKMFNDVRCPPPSPHLPLHFRRSDPPSVSRTLCVWVVQYLRKCGLKGAVVSVSGGVDSAVTLGLLDRARSMADSPLTRIIAVAQPIHSSGWALNRAREAAEMCRAPMIVLDQTQFHTEITYDGSSRASERAVTVL